jgi:DNA polymerase III delta prime subunit
MELVNDITKKWIDAFINNPKASTIIETDNDPNAGEQISRYLYEQIIESRSVPYFAVDVKEDKKSIGVDDVKEFKEYLSLKADIDGSYTRFVVVHSAEFLTREAQNALLKIIEELPTRTILLLIVNDKSKILETINSRCFRIKILPVEFNKAEVYAKNQSVERDVFKRSYLMSEGRSSVFLDLMMGNSNDTENIIDYVKKFISSDIYQRQIIVRDYTKNYDNDSFIKSIQLVSKTSMRIAKKIEDKHKWKSILEKSIIAEERLNHNVSSKLVLLSLSVSI